LNKALVGVSTATFRGGEMLDLLIRNAVVVDGSGSEPFVIDVGVYQGRIVALDRTGCAARKTINADGLTLAPGIVDLHTHYDAQVTWDKMLSPSPALGVTSVVMGNCGFGIAPNRPPVQDLILRNLSVVEGMDLEALRCGVDWQFQSFPEYLDVLRKIGPYLNVAVFAGHSVIRTTVMGEAASIRNVPTSSELTEMKNLVAEAMAGGAVGLSGSYSLNHCGYDGVPMPSTITELQEFSDLIGTMMKHGGGVVQIAAGAKTPDQLETISQEHGCAIFQQSPAAMYNERDPDRAVGVYDACVEAQTRGNQLYTQVACQPVSFDFTLDNAYPFYSHDAFSEVKSFDAKRLKKVFRDSGFRERFRKSLANPRPGMIFLGNWERVTVAVPARSENRGLAGQTIGEISRERGVDPVDVIFDLGLEEDLETRFLGEFLNIGDEGVLELLRHDGGVLTLSDAGAHLAFMCDAGFGLHFLSKWVHERGDFSLAEGVRRLTSHPAELYGLRNRGRICEAAHADLLLFDPAEVGVTAPERVSDLPGGGARMIRRPRGVHGVFVNGIEVFDGKDYVEHVKGPGHVLDSFDR